MRVAVDIGGTFTDVVVFDEAKSSLALAKALSTPAELARGVEEGLTKAAVPLDQVLSLIHGSTIVVNAIIERRGAKTALITTKGFRDVYEIGRINRPESFNPRFRKHRPLVPRENIFEVTERMLADGSVRTPFDEQEAREVARIIKEEDFEAVAVLFLHSYRAPEHEIRMGSHLNHLIFTLPIFNEGELIAFSCSMAHWQDIGGQLGGVTRDIFSEGLQIPFVKIFRAGEENPEITSIIRANVRVPERAMGDMTTVGDPVGLGFVASLARPGGNITGLSTYSTDLAGKRLELLKETILKLSRVAIVSDPRSLAAEVKETEAAARLLKVQLIFLEVQNLDDLENAFRSIARSRVDAIVIGAGGFFNTNQRRLVELAAKHRLPGMYIEQEFVLAGGLMNEGSWLRFPNPISDNRKSKACAEPRRSIQNLNLVGIVALVVTFAMCGAVVEAQQMTKVRKIGYLSGVSPAAEAARREAFRQALRELGFIEGKTVVIEYRYSEGKYERLPGLAAELVRLKPDLIVTGGSPSTRAAKEVTNTIPIVMTNDPDPVANGLITSLARPAGNITGLSTLAPELSGKRLEILREVVPKLSRMS